MNGYRYSVGGTKVSLMVRADTQRSRLSMEPALSLVPLALAPPTGCWPTTAPVGLSLIVIACREPQRLVGFTQRPAVGGEHRAGEGVGGGRVHQLEGLGPLALRVDIQRHHGTEDLLPHGGGGRAGG